MIAFGQLKMLKVVIIILSKEKKKRKERGNYHDWYKDVMVVYIGDMVKWESTNKISERLNFGERKVHNITNNLSQKKKKKRSITSNPFVFCILRSQIIFLVLYIYRKQRIIYFIF